MVDFSRLPFFMDKEGKPAFIIVVGEDCTSKDIILASAVASKIGHNTGEFVESEIIDIVKFDEEIREEDKKLYHMILIGKPETNTLIRDILHSGARPLHEIGEDSAEDKPRYMFFKDFWGYGTHVLIIMNFAIMEAPPPG